MITCIYCGQSLEGGVLTLPWEDGDNPNAYVRCPHCGGENIQYGFGEDDDISNKELITMAYDYNEDYNEEDRIRSYKQDDSYHFSFPFEYIAENHGNGEYDIDEAVMEVELLWDDERPGYFVSYYVPDEECIDPDQGNNIEEIFEYDVSDRLWCLLREMDIPEFAVESEAERL